MVGFHAAERGIGYGQRCIGTHRGQLPTSMAGFTISLTFAAVNATKNSEVSTSDSTWLVAGSLTARQYFQEDPHIAQLATTIYNRVD